MEIYRGLSGVNREIKQQYRGLSGANREIKEQYRGAGGVNRKVFSAFEGDAYTGLLLHFEGSVIDTSGHIAPTVIGTPQYVSGKFGSALNVQASGAHVQIPYNSNLNLSAYNDWTVDFWYKHTSNEIDHADGGFLTCAPSSGPMNTGFSYRVRSNQVKFAYGSGSAEYEFAPNGLYLVVMDGLYHHHAVTKTGTTFRFFYDGVLQYTGTAVVAPATDALLIGRARDKANYLAGCIDEYRISPNIARWSANFTPPTQPYS